MALYIGSRKYAITQASYRGFWAIIIGGFAGTIVTCNGTSVKYIGSNERVTYKISEAGTYTFVATRNGETIERTIVLTDGDEQYIREISVYIGIQYLEYIESTGTQYIDTGISGNNDNLKIECEFIITEIPSDWSNIYGNYVNENSNSFRLVINGSSHNGFFTSNTQTGQGQIGYNFQTDTKYTIESSYLKSIINNTTYNYSQKIIGDENNTTILLFNSSTISGFLGTPIKLYSFKIYDNDVLVRDFVPVADNTNHGALFDKVTQQIYYNSGAGEFICGPKKPYTRIQYLEGTCNEQYIDLGIVPTSDMTYYGKFGFQSVISGSYEFFGARDTMGSGLLTYTTISDNNMGIDFFRTSSERYIINNVNPVVNDIFVFDIQNKTMKISKNGSVIDTHTFADDGTTTETLYLNGTHSTNAPTSGRGIGRIYAFKVWNNGELVRDMIPVLDNEGNPCMYDRENDRLYYNQGTDEFIAGPTTIDLEYVESTGVQWVNTGIVPTTTTEIRVKAKFNQLGTNLWDNVIGGKGDTQLNETRFYAFGTDQQNTRFRFTLGTSEVNAVWDTNVHEVVFNNSNHQVVLDNVIKGTLNPSAFTAGSQPMYLFCYATPDLIAGWSYCRVYSCDIYQDGVLVRNFIPRKLFDGSVGLYDTVSETFFTSGTKTELIAGPEKQ